MWLFRKPERAEVWDQEIEGPLGDIEAAHRIRDICHSVADSAEKVRASAAAADGKRTNDKRKKYEAERYQRAAKAAMEVAMKISDDLLRDSSVRDIVNLCVKANDLTTAQILLRAIQATSIREDVLKENSMLRQ